MTLAMRFMDTLSMNINLIYIICFEVLDLATIKHCAQFHRFSGAYRKGYWCWNERYLIELKPIWTIWTHDINKIRKKNGRYQLWQQLYDLAALIRFVCHIFCMKWWRCSSSDGFNVWISGGQFIPSISCHRLNI